jgi:hypothetical protein
MSPSRRCGWWIEEDGFVRGKRGGVGGEDGENVAGTGTLAAARDECDATDVFGITSNITMLRITSGCVQVIEQLLFQCGSL